MREKEIRNPRDGAAMTFEQIAEEMGITCGAARQLYCKALRKLAARPNTIAKLQGLAVCLQDVRHQREREF